MEGTSMRVNVRLFAALKDVAGAGTLALEIAEEATVADVWETLAARHPELWAYGAALSYSVNQTIVPRDAALTNGDEVAFLPPVSGGRDG
jgi:molybdopterin converting factor subunit 1